MVKLKEKIVLKSKGDAFVVQSLENRLTPKTGTAITAETVEKLLLEAKVSGCLTVKIL